MQSFKQYRERALIPDIYTWPDFAAPSYSCLANVQHNVFMQYPCVRNALAQTNKSTVCSGPERMEKDERLLCSVLCTLLPLSKSGVAGKTITDFKSFNEVIVSGIWTKP